MAAQKKVYRARKDSILGGVCAGIGNYFKCDPVLVRIIAVLITFLTAFIGGIIAYLILWIIIPLEPQRKKRRRRKRSSSRRKKSTETEQD